MKLTQFGVTIVLYENMRSLIGEQMEIGDKVIANFPDNTRSEVGTIVEGPIVRNGMAAFKVHYVGFDNWLPAAWLKPYLQAVNEK